MASIFRTVKHEDQSEFNKFAIEQKLKVKTRDEGDKELLRLDDNDNHEEHHDDAT